VDETGCFAAACLAGAGIGLFASADEPVRAWVQPVRTFEPDPARSEVYDSIFADYLGLYQAVSPISHSVTARRRPAP
jgi:sugar (pentulose or hexulose) kinase